MFFISMPLGAAERLTVFAAASLKSALDEVVDASGRDVAVSYGGSGLIARQVALGAPADLVILANEGWMDWLIAQPGVTAEAPMTLLGNRLVLIAPATSGDLEALDAPSLLARLDGGRIATGLTEGVPAGIYARQWMTRAGLWGELAPHLAETDNARAVLALVVRGEAPLGVVYASDAQADPRVRVLYAVPQQMHDPIRYPVAVIHGRNDPEAIEFQSFLFSSRAGEIFAAHGFLLPEDAR